MTTTLAAQPRTAWQIDPTHTDVEFTVRHLMISNVKGRFANATGAASFDLENPGKAALEVTIPVATIDTGVEQRDAHLRSPDFFDAPSFPAMTYRARRVEGDLTGHFRLIGDLTIRGVTREVPLDVTLEGRANDPWGNERLGYHATGKIDRREFGLTWNQALETGGVAVGHEVKIAIDAELTRPLAQA
ncbi:MAG TPA: YceI family protein [Gemmatimonadales bacterium]|nr:YceI family protein [Gemmatimonadales bacterium]